MYTCRNAYWYLFLQRLAVLRCDWGAGLDGRRERSECGTAVCGTASAVDTATGAIATKRERVEKESGGRRRGIRARRRHEQLIGDRRGGRRQSRRIRRDGIGGGCGVCEG